MAKVNSEINQLKTVSSGPGDGIDVRNGEVEEVALEKLDEAEVFLRENNHTWEQVEALLADKKRVASLVKKVDWHLLPLLMVTYGLQLIDKTTLSSAAVFDLRSDTHLVGNQYAWVSSIFYFGMFPLLSVALQ